MLTAIKQRLDREDEGFTLIELMVVVLIIAILLAIAIPTFLSAKNSANAKAAQSDLNSALTTEQTYWTNQQSFLDTSTAGGITSLKGLESSIDWVAMPAATTNPNEVAATISSTDSSVVMLQAAGKDGNCYYIEVSNDPTLSYTAYAETKGACVAPTSVSLLTGAPAAGATTLDSTNTTPVAADWASSF